MQFIIHINMIGKILELLSPHERRRAGLLLGMVIVMALLDMAGVASIMPFMAVVVNPEIIDTNLILKSIFNELGFANKNSFLIFLGIMVFVIMIISLSFKALTIYAQVRFTRMREYTIGRRLTEGYLNQPYSWILGRHSSDLSKNILSEVALVIGGSLSPMMNLITHSIVMVVMVALLLIVETKLTIIVLSMLGLSYGLLFGKVGGYLSRIGMARKEANELRFIALNEAFSAFKEVKFGRLEKYYLKQFSKPSKKLAKHHASGTLVQQLPHFVLEAITFGGLALMVVYLMADGGYASTLPIISLYALAGYRIMPALQGIYSSLSQLRFTKPSLEALHAELSCLSPLEKISSDISPVDFIKSIELKNISYVYPMAKKTAIQDISIMIPVNSAIGVVGTTGSGKTTIIDVILGLLEPSEGSLLIDGIKINKINRHLWQDKIGYVPQQIYMADDTIASNIALGVDLEKVDKGAVIRSAKIANLHNFIIDDLPEGYDTIIGERGVRLSGGQRQRIGIARALYFSPKVLIMDEATSALDNLTEEAVMEAVRNLNHEITIIMIAHRLSTVRQCDIIFLLEKGSLVAKGNFDSLIKNSEGFQKMAQCESP